VDRQRPKEPRSALAQNDKETAITFPAVRPRTSALRPGTPRCSKRSPTPATSAVPTARRGSRFTRSPRQTRVPTVGCDLPVKIERTNHVEPRSGYCFSASSGNRSIRPSISPEVRNNTASSLRNSAPILARPSAQECMGMASTPAAYTRSIISLRLACSWVPAPWFAGSNMKTRSQPLNTSSYHSSLLRLRHENV
jgi:hypothetical protein